MNKPSYATDLYGRIHAEIEKIPLIDCHEHLQRDSELPAGDHVHIGRFFAHYATCDYVTAGMPVSDMNRVQTDASLSPRDRWALLEPWYRKVRNTTYCESLRIAIRDLYGIEDFAANTVDVLTEHMRGELAQPGFTRRVFDRAGIDYAMNNPFGPKQVFNPDMPPDCFIPDMIDAFTSLPIKELREESGMEIESLDDYLKVIDFYFERDAACAGAFKVGRAYSRTLFWDDVSKADAERIFSDVLRGKLKPITAEAKPLEDFLMHELCRKCGEHGLRMKFHTGLQEGNSAQIITNSRAALMINLFAKYPDTGFDMYHISYPYQEELAVLAKNYPNVTVDFCWMWIINPAAGRRALSDMLDFLPASKIHGFGGDYIFAEGSYAHAKIARREIARVLCEKVEEGRFSEEEAVTVGRMLLRENPIENFGLEKRREAFLKRVGS